MFLTNVNFHFIPAKLEPKGALKTRKMLKCLATLHDQNYFPPAKFAIFQKINAWSQTYMVNVESGTLPYGL